MKKLLLFFAALLLCSLAHSQEAEGTGSYADFRFVPRFDFNPYFTPGSSGDGSSGYSFGNSSIYTFIEGAFSDNISFTLSNHWLAASKPDWEDTAKLYTSTFHSNAQNWLDILTVDFSVGNWTFTVGKDCILTGGFEYEDYDVDCDYMLAGETILYASNLWLNLPGYQWGAKASYNLLDHTKLSLQMVTSPFGDYFFTSGLFCYSGMTEGSYGPFFNRWSASAIQRPDGGFEWLVALSNKLDFAEAFTFGFDWYNCVDIDYDLLGLDAPCELLKGSTFRPSLAWAPAEQFDCRVIANVYTRLKELYDLNVAAMFHYRPIESIQLQAGLGWDLYSKMMAASVGVKVDLTFLSL